VFSKRLVKSHEIQSVDNSCLINSFFVSFATISSSFFVFISSSFFLYSLKSGSWNKLSLSISFISLTKASILESI
jgi:hypothetical protein